MISKQSGFTMMELEKLLEEIKSFNLKANLDELIDTGFIKPIGRFAHASKHTKYIVSDPFCNFFNKWHNHLVKRYRNADRLF